VVSFLHHSPPSEPTAGTGRALSRRRTVSPSRRGVPHLRPHDRRRLERTPAAPPVSVPAGSAGARLPHPGWRRASMTLFWRAGRPVKTEDVATGAEGLATRVPVPEA